jgi:hypothetical protein
LVHDAASTDRSHSQAAIDVTDALDEFIPKLTARDVVNNAQNLPSALQNWRKGVTNYGVGKLAEMIEQKRENAKINNNAAHTGDNGYNALQQ